MVKNIRSKDMQKKVYFNSQFHLQYEDYLKGIDLQNWFRYYTILKTVIDLEPRKVLEIGAGNEIVKSSLLKLVNDYQVMDINPKLKPDILADLREFRPELKEKFDYVICADVLEHMPFEDLRINLTNIYNYLTPGGWALITIPHRETRLMIISPFSHQRALIIPLPGLHTPRGYRKILKDYLNKKIDLDPHHCWEIGRIGIKVSDVEKKMKETGFQIAKFQKLLYVDFWLLKK